MSSTEAEFITAAVRNLFEKIRRGNVPLAAQEPAAVEALEAVRFDEEGNPIPDSVSPVVRALAYDLAKTDLEQETAERKVSSAIHEYLGPPVSVNPEVLQECASKQSYSLLAFELYKETAIVLSVCSHAYIAPTAAEAALPRNQAICAGLLVRVTKFMSVVASLVAQDANRGDVVFALNRSITESATNLRFLLLKNEDRFFDQFVRFSLSPEREQYDLIQRNIAARGGAVLPIEQRMLRSIEKVCRLSNVPITEVEPRAGDWGGGLRNRLDALGQGETYAAQQRLPSHAVHGTWVDLVQHHLVEVDCGFRPDASWSRVDARLMLPICVLVLSAAHAYMQTFPPLPEIEPLLERIVDLDGRIRVVDQAHENWLSGESR